MEEVITEQTEERQEGTQEINPATMPSEELGKLLRGEPITEEKETTAAEETKAEEQTGQQAEEKAAEPAKPTPDELAAIQAENEKLKEAVKNQDKLLAKFGTEIGLMRKRTPEQEREEVERIRDLWLENPIEGQKALDEYKQQEEMARQAAEQHHLMQFAQENRTIVTRDIPEFDANIDKIAAILEEDGANRETVQMFRQMPYLWDRSLLLNLHKRQAMKAENTTLQSEIEKLRAENEALRKRPDELLKKIEKAAGSTTLSAKTGGAATKADSAGSQPVYALSREQLRKISTGG